MEQAFTVSESEWWYFDYRGGRDSIGTELTAVPRDYKLASLGGPPALPGRLEEFDSSGNVQCTPCREPLKHHDREYPWTTTRT
jgi:hypothetical protein